MAFAAHILVPVDFGAAAQRAALLACDLAKTFDAKITLLHSYELPIAVGVPATFELGAAREGAKAELQRVQRELHARGIEAETLMAEGPTAEMILTAAAEQRATLIVMGTHGRRGVARAILGSVTEKVVRTATIPVLTVTPWRFVDRADAGRRLGDALGARRERIGTVVGIDRGGLAVACEIARALGACCAHLATAGAKEEIATARVPDALPAEPIVITTDALANVAALAAAAQALRERGATRVIAAVPVCGAKLREELERVVDDVVCLETAEGTATPHDCYRDHSPPSPRELSALLERASSRTAAHA